MLTARFHAGLHRGLVLRLVADDDQGEHHAHGRTAGTSPRLEQGCGDLCRVGVGQGHAHRLAPVRLVLRTTVFVVVLRTTVFVVLQMPAFTVAARRTRRGPACRWRWKDPSRPARTVVAARATLPRSSRSDQESPRTAQPLRAAGTAAGHRAGRPRSTARTPPATTRGTSRRRRSPCSLRG